MESFWLISYIAKLLEWPAQDLLITGGLAIEAVVFGVSAVKFVDVKEKHEGATEATLAKVADGLGNIAGGGVGSNADTYINIQAGTAKFANTGIKDRYVGLGTLIDQVLAQQLNLQIVDLNPTKRQQISDVFRAIAWGFNQIEKR